MTTKFVQDGTTINYSTTAAVTAGTLLIVGDMPVVALETKAATTAAAPVACAAEGVFTLTKKAAASTNWLQGGKVGYIVTGGVNALTGVLTSGKIIGTGWAAATTTATTGTIKLRGGSIPTANL